MLGVSQCNAAVIKSAIAINHLDFVALDQPQHSGAMARLFLGKSESVSYVGGEESMHTLNINS